MSLRTRLASFSISLLFFTASTERVPAGVLSKSCFNSFTNSLRRAISFSTCILCCSAARCSCSRLAFREPCRCGICSADGGGEGQFEPVRCPHPAPLIEMQRASPSTLAQPFAMSAPTRTKVYRQFSCSRHPQGPAGAGLRVLTFFACCYHRVL